MPSSNASKREVRSPPRRSRARSATANAMPSATHTPGAIILAPRPSQHIPRSSQLRAGRSCTSVAPAVTATQACTAWLAAPIAAPVWTGPPICWLPKPIDGSVTTTAPVVIEWPSALTRRSSHSTTSAPHTSPAGIHTDRRGPPATMATAHSVTRPASDTTMWSATHTTATTETTHSRAVRGCTRFTIDGLAIRRLPSPARGPRPHHQQHPAQHGYPSASRRPLPSSAPPDGTARGTFSCTVPS